MKRNMMIVLAAVFAAIFLFSGMMLWQDYRDQEASAEVFDNVANLIVEETQPAPEPSAEDAETQPAEPTEPAAEMTAYEKYAAVYAQNNDFVGWLCIEGTNINYPVMQTPEEPNYYLKRAFDHSYSDYGVPYVQENCVLGISDNIVIYGHNMSNGSMFADTCFLSFRCSFCVSGSFLAFELKRYFINDGFLSQKETVFLKLLVFQNSA